MKENKLMPICILILSASIMFGSLWIGFNIKNINNSSEKLSYDKALLTDEEAAQYLNLSLGTLEKLIIQNDIERKQTSTYETFKYVPYMTIEGKRYFNKEHVDKWIEFNSLRYEKFEINLK